MRLGCKRLDESRCKMLDGMRCIRFGEARLHGYMRQVCKTYKRCAGLGYKRLDEIML